MACTKSPAWQLLEKGLRDNVVAPGPFWDAPQSSGGHMPEKVMKFAFGRPGQPVEIAPVHVPPASQEGNSINGEVRGVTGGAGVA